MELPNNTYSSEAAKQMEFAEGFNPELTTEEKIRAAVEFDDLVQSTLLSFAGDAKTYDHTVFTDRVESSILLEIPQEDGSRVLVSVESATLDNGDEKRFISITESDGRDKESHHYYAKGLSAEGLEHNIATLKNEIENDKLEQQMGLNRQPVGVEEISKLAELLESAEPCKLY